MPEENRSHVTELLKAALLGDASTVDTMVNDEKVVNSSNSKSSIPEFLFRCKDPKTKRNALHYACQAPFSKSNDDDNAPDIVEVILNFFDVAKIDATTDDDIKDKNPSVDWCIKFLQQKDMNGITPIMLAVQRTNKELAYHRLEILLSKSKQLSSISSRKINLASARSHSGATSLHYAAGARALPKTTRLLYETAKVAINTFSVKGGTPLHWLCCSSSSSGKNNDDKDYDQVQDTSTLVALLECGADVNACQWKHSTTNNTTNNNDTTTTEKVYSIPPPIVMTIVAKNDMYCQRLLECPDLDLTIEYSGQSTLLHGIIESDLTKSVSTFLKRIRDSNDDDVKLKQIVSKRNRHGFTPLVLAAKQGNTRFVQLLLKATSQSATSEDVEAYIQKYTESTNQITNALKQKSLPNTQPKAPQTTQVTSKISKTSFEYEAQQQAEQIIASADISSEQYQEAIELKTKGNQYFMKKEWQSACDYYTQAITCNPKEYTLYSNRSSCCLNLKQYDNALQDAIFARMLNPNWSKACYRLAMARFSLERYEDAAVAAYDGLFIDPQNKELKSLLQKCVQTAKTKYIENQYKGQTSS